MFLVLLQAENVRPLKYVILHISVGADWGSGVMLLTPVWGLTHVFTEGETVRHVPVVAAIL